MAPGLGHRPPPMRRSRSAAGVRPPAHPMRRRTQQSGELNRTEPSVLRNSQPTQDDHTGPRLHDSAPVTSSSKVQSDAIAEHFVGPAGIRRRQELRAVAPGRPQTDVDQTACDKRPPAVKAYSKRLILVQGPHVSRGPPREGEVRGAGPQPADGRRVYPHGISKYGSVRRAAPRSNVPLEGWRSSNDQVTARRSSLLTFLTMRHLQSVRDRRMALRLGEVDISPSAVLRGPKQAERPGRQGCPRPRARRPDGSGRPLGRRAGGAPWLVTPPFTGWGDVRIGIVGLASRHSHPGHRVRDDAGERAVLLAASGSGHGLGSTSGVDVGEDLVGVPAVARAGDGEWIGEVRFASPGVGAGPVQAEQGRDVVDGEQGRKAGWKVCRGCHVVEVGKWCRTVPVRPLGHRPGRQER
jgi:hypothetical protein